MFFKSIKTQAPIVADTKFFHNIRFSLHPLDPTKLLIASVVTVSFLPEKPKHIIYVIDSSGSMKNDNNLEHVKIALQ